MATATVKNKKNTLKKGSRVICSIWGNEVATVNYFDPHSGKVGLRYGGDRTEYEAYENECELVKR